jgi:hypothetical protein
MSTQWAKRVPDVRNGLAAHAVWVVLALALCCSSCAHAETSVYLLRGWFGVFSTGMDAMAEELRNRGIKAEAIGHVAWKSAVTNVVKERAAGANHRLVLVGHSQGGNNIIDMARELEKHRIPVDLLITLAPFKQDPVPPNVVRALNYYQAGGWGSALTADPGFKGELVNIDVGTELGTFHVTIDKSARVQAEVLNAIATLSP